MANGIGLAGGFGAGGARDALVDLIAQRMAQEKFDEQKRARAEEESQGRTSLQQRAVESATNTELARARMTQDERQFGERLGLDVKREGEDVRQFDADLGFKREESGRRQGETEREFTLRERGQTETERANRAREGLSREGMRGPAGTGTGTDAKSPLTAQMRNNIAKLAETGPILDRLEQLSQGINKREGLGARAGGFTRGLSASAGMDNDASVYRSLAEGFLGQIARLSGEVGVLTDQDVKRAQRLIPQLTDTAGEAKAKFAELRGLMQSRRVALEGEVPLGEEGPIDVPDPRRGGGGSTSGWDLYQQRLKGRQ